MEDLKHIISKNLVELRKRKKYTQADLADILQYSDKAISKWEKGESLPDIEVLYQICNLYGVTLDYLTHEGNYEEKQEYVIKDVNRVNKVVISLLSVSLIWFLIIILFVYAFVMNGINLWIAFIWGVPLSALIFLIFNSIWGKKLYKFIILTVLTWSSLATIFLQVLYMNLDYQIWAIFLLGIPAQIAIILWSQLKRNVGYYIPHKSNNEELEN